MKRLCYILSFTLTLLLALSCTERRTANLQEFNVEIYTPDYAQGFKIIGAQGRQSTILQIENPWQGAEMVAHQLFIARGGEQAPAGFEGEVIEGDAERIICMSSSHVAIFDAIGEVERVVGVSGMNYITNDYVRSNRDIIGDVGQDSDANFELIVALDPDIILLYGITGASSIEGKLLELGIPYAYIGEYLEEDPLGKTEWMVALAEIVGQREKAEQIFKQIPERYEALRTMAAAALSPKPKVMINTPYADSWFMASTSSYVARLIADAGGDYIYRRNTSNTSLPIDLEEAARLCAEADVWINVGSISSLDDMRRQFPKFADVPAVESGAVYNSDRRVHAEGGNDFWESGIMHPDLILEDLHAILHSHPTTEQLHYYRKIE